MSVAPAPEKHLSRAELIEGRYPISETPRERLLWNLKRQACLLHIEKPTRRILIALGITERRIALLRERIGAGDQEDLWG